MEGYLFDDELNCPGGEAEDACAEENAKMASGKVAHDLGVGRKELGEQPT